MTGTEGSRLEYRYYWWRWTLPVLSGIWIAALTAVWLWLSNLNSLSEVELSVPKVSTLAGALTLALNAGFTLREPYKFALGEHVFRIYWLWREQVVPINRITIMQPPDGRTGPTLSLTYDWKTIHVNLNLGNFRGLRATLLRRGAQIEPGTLVKILGVDPRCKKVPLMLLLQGRAQMNQTEARDEAIRILNGERVSFRLKSKVDARQLRKELQEMGVTVQREGDGLTRACS